MGDVQAVMKRRVSANDYSTVVAGHPEILPSVFNSEEFKKDYTLSKDLASIVLRISELAEGL
jgi:hypothetical protein